MRTFAFIFARGGSKGLPGKNIKKLNGKPLIQYSIDIAKSISNIEKIFVSTDDAEITNIAYQNGAEIINRPKELAEDNSAEWAAWQHAINWVINKYGNFDYFVSLPPTSPLRSVEDIQNSIQELINTKSDICISVTPANRSPYFNMVKASENNLVELAIQSVNNITRRQDAPKLYDMTTVVYTSKPDFILNNAGLFSGKVSSILVPKERSVDIDDIYDFLLAEAIISKEHLYE